MPVIASAPGIGGSQREPWRGRGPGGPPPSGPACGARAGGSGSAQLRNPRSVVTEPLISVILPTYNRSTLLGEAVESVRRQSYRHWELVVIDDGSFDDTPTTLAKVEDDRLRILRLDHTDNPARVRNAGLAEARGRFVAFLDDDDLWDHSKLTM